MSICDAIAARNIIEFYYDGVFRVVEPHCHGWSSAGKEVVRGYQTDGSSAVSGELGWKLFSLAKISSLTITEKTFAVRMGYSQNDKGMSSIHCQL